MFVRLYVCVCVCSNVHIVSTVEGSTYPRETPPMFSGNLTPLRTWKEEEKKKKTFRGPKCHRYHYLSISLDETHLAGLVSLSQWDPEVKRASDQD